jgi:hypothetical protein
VNLNHVHASDDLGFDRLSFFVQSNKFLPLSELELGTELKTLDAILQVEAVKVGTKSRRGLPKVGEWLVETRFCLGEK